MTPISNLFRRGSLIFGVVWLAVCPLRAAPGDEHWDAQFGWPGVTNLVYGLRYHEGRLYAGGLFAPPGGVTNNQVDIWNGSEWDVLPGLSGGLIAVFDFA